MRKRYKQLSGKYQKFRHIETRTHFLYVIFLLEDQTNSNQLQIPIDLPYHNDII